MYIPKLRNAEQVVQYFKQADYDTAVSVYLLKSLARRRKIMCRFIGKKRLFNLDECLQYFTGSFRYEKIRKVRGSARKMRGTFEILNIFKESDFDTILCKMIIRRIASEEKKVFARLHSQKWIIDLDQFISFLSGKTNKCTTSVPQIRTYEKCYHLICKDYPHIKVTWNRLHDIVHSGKIFIIKHGNRWILNYDQLLEILLDEQNSNGDNV